MIKRIQATLPTGGCVAVAAVVMVACGSVSSLVAAQRQQRWKRGGRGRWRQPRSGSMEAVVAVAAAMWQWGQHGGGGGGCSSTAAAMAAVAAVWWRWRQLGGSMAATAVEARWRRQWQQLGGSVAAAAVWQQWQRQRWQRGGNSTAAGAAAVLAVWWQWRQLGGSTGAAAAVTAQPNGQQWSVVIPAATAMDHLAAMLDNSRVTKTTRKMNTGSWQQGKNKGRYNNGGDNGPPSSPTNGEDNDAAAGNEQGNATAADVDGGNVDAGTSSVVLAASNTLDHDNDAKYDNANAEDATGKKTLMRDVTAAGTGGGTLALVVILPLHDDDIHGSPYNSALMLSVAPHCRDDDTAPWHCWPSLVHA
jgi:hypothetical protein